VATVVELATDWPLWSGTARVVVRAESDDTHVLAAARAITEAEVAAIDRAASRFRTDSEVAALAAAGGRAVPVSPVLLQALQVALRASALTDGAVDSTLGGALVAVGFDRDFAALPADRATAIVPVRRTVSWRDVEVDAAAGTVRVPPGVLLDLGATAKALAADRAADAVLRRFGVPVLVELLGDLAVRGTVPGQPWVVEVSEGGDSAAQLVQIEDGGLATSSTRVRHWRMAGQPVHHLLDPVTGLPVRESWRTVSVSAASCVDANIASTATIVKGAAGLAWLRSTGLPARLVALDGSVLEIGGWPAEGTA
jgi:thiamine biosynthesis lipoprotein